MRQLFKIMLLGLGFSAISASHAAQTCNDNIQKINPSAIYKNHANGTVTDSTTNLMWQKCTLGQTYAIGSCSGTASTYNWNDSLLAAQNANAANMYGYNDWRVPNAKELQSLVEIACHSPSINESIFPGTASNYYWTTSLDSVGSESAYRLGFDYGDLTSSGNDGSKTNVYSVRLVRSGQ